MKKTIEQMDKTDELYNQLAIIQQALNELREDAEKVEQFLKTPGGIYHVPRRIGIVKANLRSIQSDLSKALARVRKTITLSELEEPPP